MAVRKVEQVAILIGADLADKQHTMDLEIHADPVLLQEMVAAVLLQLQEALNLAVLEARLALVASSVDKLVDKPLGILRLRAVLTQRSL